MGDKSVKRNYKDTVFKDLFSEPKYLFKLYKGLHPEDTSTQESDIRIITLQNILVNGVYNDLGFFVKDRIMVLVEAQSTWSPNIIVRALIYLMSTYQEYFNANSTNLYGSKIVKMPSLNCMLYILLKKADILMCCH